MSMSEPHIIYNPDGMYPFSTLLAKEQHAICFAPWVANMFWLVEPRIDTEGVEAGRGNPILLSIQDAMDVDTLHHLAKLPLQFMEFFMEFNKRDDMLMTQGWPAGYMRTMLQRAHEAQYRLLGVKRDDRDDRVIRVDFGRRSA